MKTTHATRATAAAGSVALIAAAFFGLAPAANAAPDTETTVSETATASTTTSTTEPDACLSGEAALQAALSYTFFADGTGAVTLSGTVPLCSPLHVRAQTWKFVNPATSMWPQTPVGADTFDFTNPGTYPFHAPKRVCGQTDLYASFDVTKLNVPSTTVLAGPSSGYSEPFINYVAGLDATPWAVDETPCVVPSESHTPTETTSTHPSETTSTHPTETTSTHPTETTSTHPTETTSTSVPPTTVSVPPTTISVPPTTTVTSPGVSVSGTSTTTAASTPPVVSTSATSPGVSVSGTSTANTPSPTATTPPAVLPFTGGHVGSIALFGALGIFAGLALMLATRKPRQQ